MLLDVECLPSLPIFPETPRQIVGLCFDEHHIASHHGAKGTREEVKQLLFFLLSLPYGHMAGAPVAVDSENSKRQVQLPPCKVHIGITSWQQRQRVLQAMAEIQTTSIIIHHRKQL